MTKPVLIERKLGRERAAGQAHSDGLIEIDPRQRARDRLDTIIHEASHIALPDASERDVARMARVAARLLWRDRWRRIDI
jgi:hypothetical protein